MQHLKCICAHGSLFKIQTMFPLSFSCHSAIAFPPFLSSCLLPCLLPFLSLSLHVLAWDLAILFIYIFFSLIFCQAGKLPFGVLPTPISTTRDTHTHTCRRTRDFPCHIASHPVLSNIPLNTISNHLLILLPLYHLLIPPAPSLSTFLPPLTPSSSSSLSFCPPPPCFHTSFPPPMFHLSIFPSAVMRKQGLLSWPVCMCVFIRPWGLHFRWVHLPWHDFALVRVD